MFFGGVGARAGVGWRAVVASSRNYFLSLIGKMPIAYTNRSNGCTPTLSDSRTLKAFRASVAQSKS